MKGIKDSFYTILFIIIIIIILFIILKGCSNNNKNIINTTSEPIIIYKTDTIRDTIFSIDTITLNKPILKYIDVPIYIDTNKVIKDYYVIREYKDTLVNDSNLIIVTKESIQHNKLNSIIVSYINMKPTIINNTKYIYEQEINHLYIGAFLNGSKDYLVYGPQITYTKNKLAYNAGFGINNKSLYIGINYKLK
jgi:hypothetical protein